MPAQIMYELEHGVVRITLSRPEKRNALSLRMLEDFSEALDRASNERNARVLVLAAIGTAFCAGMDLKDVRLDEDDQASQFAATLAAVYRKLLTFPLVTLCAVDGRAVGGGVGIACAADMLWAGSEASFSLPETRIGVVPALVSVVLRRRLPPIRLSGLLMTGRVLDPAQAVGVGLADVVAENSAHAEAKQYAHRLVRENSGEAMSRTRLFLNEHSGARLVDELDVAQREFRAAVNTSAARRGLAAFRECESFAWDDDLEAPPS